MLVTMSPPDESKKLRGSFISHLTRFDLRPLSLLDHLLLAKKRKSHEEDERVFGSTAMRAWSSA